MKPTTLCSLCLCVLSGSASSHGAPYNPPPPQAPTPTDPGPIAPRAPPPPQRPGNPASPSTPTGPSQGKGTNTGLATIAANGTIESSSWEFWWLYNQDRFLDLKTHVDALDVQTGGDTDWLGGSGAVPSADTVTKLVVPVLLGLIEKEHGNEVLTSTTIALARLADGPIAARAGEFARAFAPLALDANQEVAETAVLGRGLVGDEGSAFDLVALLADTEAARRANGGKSISPRSRAFAAYALGFLAARSRNEDVRRFIVHHLVKALNGERGATPDVHVACVLALGLAPLPWTEKANDGNGAPPASPAATSIASASRQTEIECLLTLLSDEKGDRWVRAHASASLAKLALGASPESCRVVTEALLAPLAPNAGTRDEVMQGCVLALGRMDGVDVPEIELRVRSTLQRVADAGERQARSFALIALAQRAVRAGVEASAVDARVFLAKRLLEGRSNERAWAALALGILEHGRKTPGETNALSVRASLVAALKDCGSPDELGALAIACGLCAEPAAVPILLQRLEHASEPRLQGHLAVALGLIGDQHAVLALRGQLATARFRPDLLRQTAIGLALLEDRTLVPTLVETLAKAASLASQGAAASVIGWIGDRRAVTPLLELLAKGDVTDGARGFAIVALGRVCDRDRLPWNAVISEDVNYRAPTVTLLSGDGTGLLDIL